MVLLKPKIRQFVKKTLDTTDINNDTSKVLEDIFNNGKTISYRLMWGFILVICFGICFYQTYERIAYFASSPIRVNTNFIDSKQIPVPKLSLYGLDTPLLRPYWNGTDLSTKMCAPPVRGIIAQPEVFNYTDVWVKSNITGNMNYVRVTQNGKKVIETIFKDGKIVSHKGGYFEIQHETTIFGVATILSSHSLTLTRGLLVEVRMKRNGTCPMPTLMASIVNEMQPYKYTLPIAMETSSKVTIDIRLHAGLPTRKKYCETDEKVALNCYRNCIAKKEGNQATCRLPYMYSVEGELSDCSTMNNSAIVKEVYKETGLIESSTLSSIDCSCPIPCQRIMYNPKFYVDKIADANAADLKFEYSEDLIMLLTDEFSYTLISFLTDLGGNLGFSLGLCVLSMVQTIMRYYIKEKLTTESKFGTNSGHEAGKYRALHFSLMVLCTVFTFYVMVDRIFLYRSKPTICVVTIEEEQIVNLPNLITCADGNKMTKMRMKYAKQLRKDICSIDFIDLLNSSSKPSLEDVWKSQVVDVADGVMKIAAEFIEAPPTNTTWTPIDTHLGRCLEFKFAPQQYVGAASLTFVKLDFITNKCNGGLFKVFIRTPDSQEIHSIISNYRIIDEKVLSAVEVKYSKNTILNKKTRPCVDIETFKTCEKLCFQNEIAANVNCRLPFMVSNFKTPCNDSNEAKETLSKYIKISLQTDTKKKCGCIPPCTKTLLQTNVNLAPPDTAPYALLTFRLSDNLMEEFVETEKYSIVAFFCDIGNAFSLMLGISVLTFPEIFQAPIGFIRKYVFKP